MSTEMHTNGVLSQNLLNTIHRTLTLSYVDLDLGGADTLSYLDKFFWKVEWWEVSIAVIFPLHDYWWCKQESEVEPFLDHTEHILDGM